MAKNFESKPTKLILFISKNANFLSKLRLMTWRNQPLVVLKMTS